MVELETINEESCSNVAAASKRVSSVDPPATSVVEKVPEIATESVDVGITGVAGVEMESPVLDTRESVQVQTPPKSAAERVEAVIESGVTPVGNSAEHETETPGPRQFR